MYIKCRKRKQYASVYEKPNKYKKHFFSAISQRAFVNNIKYYFVASVSQFLSQKTNQVNYF